MVIGSQVPGLTLLVGQFLNIWAAHFIWTTLSLLGTVPWQWWQLWGNDPHQEGTEHEEADKIGNGKIAPAGKLFSRAEVRLWVTPISRKAGKHYLLPCLTSGTPGVCGGYIGVKSWRKGYEVMANDVMGSREVKRSHFSLGLHLVQIVFQNFNN